MANKVTYGFDKVHYALYKEGNDGALGTFETPIRIPGAVGFSPTAQGSKSDFWADNTNYFSVTQDNGVQGDLEMALFPEKFLVDVLNWALDTKGILIERANVAQNPFALLFEVLGDEEPIRVCYYHCLGAKPNDAYITAKDNATIQGKTMAITAKPLDFGDFATAKTSATRSKDPATFSSWFNQVYIPTSIAQG